MPCDALARVNATVAKQTLIAELFAQPEVARKVLSVLQQLTAAGIPLENISTVERHRHPETDTVLAHGVRQKTQT